MNQNEMLVTDGSEARPGVNWAQVGWFLGLTFGLTWALNLFMYLAGGLTNPGVGLALQFQMLLPAFSAILLGTFFFKNSPLYFRTNRTASRWFTYYYLVFCVIYLGAVIFGFLQPAQVQTVASLIFIPMLVGLLLAVILRLVGRKNAFAGAGMAGGKALYWLLFGIGFVLLYGLQTLLNAVFQLGKPVDVLALYPMLATSGQSASGLQITAAINSILIGPFLGILLAFGEEYGWRGFLQSELTRLGRVRGVLLLGVIWGIWHWPVIWMGYNYPGQPLLGTLLMTLYTIALAFVLAYAVFKAKGIWIAAYLHALNNQTLSYFVMMVYAPSDPAYAFGIGLPGLIVVFVGVGLILRDPVWKQA